MTSKGQWSEKVVLITGASAGIGAALSEIFAKQGAKVALTARRLERLEELSISLNEQGYQTLPLRCDVTDQESVQACIDQVIEHWGHLDVVIANAGFGVAGAFKRLKVEEYQRQFDTNIFGVIHTLKSALPHLENSKGRAVIIGSVNGYVSLSKNSAYAMSKFAVRALAQSLWIEWAKLGVSTTLIEPGFVETEIRKVNNKGVYKAEAKDFVPSWLMMPALKAAQQISRATYKRKREVVITGHGKVLVWLARHWPWLTFQLLKRAR
jgi:short-subunit dehydrogenase